MLTTILILILAINYGTFMGIILHSYHESNSL